MQTMQLVEGRAGGGVSLTKMGYLQVTNWRNFQHYRDRSPPWIKLHRSIASDYEFSCLPDEAKGHLMMIWLLASELDNRIPADPTWIARRQGLQSEPDLDLLVISGFLEPESEVQAEGKQPATDTTERNGSTPLERGRAEGEAKGEQSSARLLEHWLKGVRRIQASETERLDLNEAVREHGEEDSTLAVTKVLAFRRPSTGAVLKILREGLYRNGKGPPVPQASASRPECGVGGTPCPPGAGGHLEGCHYYAGGSP